MKTSNVRVRRSAWTERTLQPRREKLRIANDTLARNRAAAPTSAALATALLVVVSGCALTPRGYHNERAAMQEAGRAFRREAAAAPLPSPNDADKPRVFLRRALLANGDVRAAWAEWRAAVERVPGSSAWPNTNLGLGYSYLFSDSNVKTFDRMSFQAGTDTMRNLSYPGKTMASGRVALANAQAAGERFRAAKFAVQRSVLDAWLDLVLAAEEERLARSRSELAHSQTDASEAALAAGSQQGPSLSAQVLAARSDDDIGRATARAQAARAKLAGLTALDDITAVGVPERLPIARPLPSEPSVLFEAVSDAPSVKELVADRHARNEEKDLAELQWVPDINPFVAVTGGIEQGVGAAVMLPTTIVEIRSDIAVAKAMRQAATARLTQARRDRREQLRALLIAAADNERARLLLADRIVPTAVAAADSAESAYRTSRGELAEVLAARMLVVDARVEIAEAIVAREKNLTAIEELLGADLETFLDGPTTRLAAGAPPLQPSAASQLLAKMPTENLQ